MPKAPVASALSTLTEWAYLTLSAELPIKNPSPDVTGIFF